MAIGDGRIRLNGAGAGAGAGPGERPRRRGAFQGLHIAASGLSAQRVRVETAGENIAMAGTRSADGTPYRRKVVELRPVEFADALDAASRADAPGGVEVAGVYEDATPGQMIYDPSHPDADENGMLDVGNVNSIDEMMDLLDARRRYDANATVFDAMKAMLRRAAQL